MTLEDTGMLTALRHGPGITLLDRAQAKTPEETKKIYHDALSSDFYLMSTNAITKDGELVNIDGTGNRVAALIYGPEHVIVMAGMNKVAANVDEALSRVHGTATPMNCKRLGKNTPCSATGVCSDCLSPDCICNQVVITRQSGIEGRIKVILSAKNLDTKVPNTQKKSYRKPVTLFAYFSCTFFFLLLQISSCVLRLASRSVLSYESPAEYLPLRSFF